MNLNAILEKLLKRTGEWYIIIVIGFTQIGASSTFILGLIFERLNADYPPELVAVINRVQGIGITLAVIVLLGTAFFLSRRIRSRLKIWNSSPETFHKTENNKAWKDTYAITWKYALSAAAISLAIVVLPKSSTIYYSEYATWDQFVYSLIAGAISTLAFIPLSTAILDTFLIPLRVILLPENFEQQLAGRSNLKLLYKNLVMIFISLVVTTLLIAPIGYHQTVKVLYEEIGSQTVLSDLRVQSIFVSILAILFASGLSYLVTKSISTPVEQLLETFQKVESGDLTSRVPVISSDEVGELAIYFNRMIVRLQELQSNLEEKVNERTAQLQAINKIGRAATSSLDPDELLHRIVNLVTDEFGYYFSAVYLLDSSGQQAFLKEASGEAGSAFKESKHRLDINEPTAIGLAIRSRTAQIASNIKEQTARFDSKLLPYSHSEIVLPLLVGNRILGALDVHSSREAAFQENDIETLQNMANQVAISLDNARLFQETRQSLNEMQSIQKQYLHEAWLDTNLPQSGISLAVGEREENIKGRKKLEVSIALRDQIIGQITLEGDEALSREDENWVGAVATQAAFALENARLLEESQSVAMREKFVTEITNKIWSSTTIDGVLQTTVRELGQILDATDATIEIDVTED